MTKRTQTHFEQEQQTAEAELKEAADIVTNKLTVILPFVNEVRDDFSSDSGTTSPIYLLIYGLQRARDLRQDAFGGNSFSVPSFDSDPFSDSFNNEPPPPDPSQQFPTILRDGPEVDVHTIMWCDTVTNLNRTLDSRSLREWLFFMT